MGFLAENPVNIMLLNPAIAALWAACLVSVVQGHGKMLHPISRSSMWRFGYDVPPNWNDNELNCGGYDVRGASTCLTLYYFHDFFIECFNQIYP